jgi:predicted nucleotide-binding protein
MAANYDRIVLVRSPGVDGKFRVGSGLLVADDLVLTAAHLIESPPTAVQGRLINSKSFSCEQIWVNEELDLTIARITEPDWTSPEDLSELRWGKIDNYGARLSCDAVAFPRSSRDQEGRRWAEHIEGHVYPGVGREHGRFAFNVDSPIPVTNAAWDNYSPWAGVSGAPIFCGDFFIGIIMNDDPQYGHRRLWAMPASAILENHQAEALIAHPNSVVALESIGATQQQARPKGSAKQSIFIVHGHDNALKEAVARTLEQVADAEVVILHEQPDAGRTLIEKFERHAEDATFAVILLSLDDRGYTEGANIENRPRQNVILELGYFIGRLGRERVCALYRGDVTLPSDVAGVLYKRVDEGVGWKLELALELKNAGVTVDLNRL